MLEATVHGGCEGGSCGRVCMGLGGQRELLRGRICGEKKREGSVLGLLETMGQVEGEDKKIKNKGGVAPRLAARNEEEGQIRGERRKMERLWSGVCWSVRGITVERGRKR